jgi:transposase
MASEFVVEHLNHLGIVVEVCREIGVAHWLDAQNPTSRQQISVGTATVAMVLNGLGLSNHQLYLLPQFFEDKPVEALLGPGISAADLNDDCLGRTLDWLYAHDVSALFAGLALRARRVLGIPLARLHADTTSFAVSGTYVGSEAAGPAAGTTSIVDAAEAASELDDDAPAVIHVTYGYSRDHRDHLKQWMLALITSGEGVPQFLQPLNGNASDKAALPHVVMELTRQLREQGEDAPGIYVADSGLYCEANMRALQAAGVRWVSRVPETSRVAQALMRTEPPSWQHSVDGQLHWWGRLVPVERPNALEPAVQPRAERWLVVRSLEGELHARAALQRQAERERAHWDKRWWHLGHRAFACEADARAALQRDRAQMPAWLVVQTDVVAVPKYGRVGRPRLDAVPIEQEWHIYAHLAVDAAVLEHEVRPKAAFIVATNVLDPISLPDLELIGAYKGQSVVERGFAFLKDPLFLASSVFVKKPERIMALAFLMVLCLLVYRLAEVRVRQRLAQARQTVPNQLKQPTVRPTMRWLFQCFEGIDLHHMLEADGTRRTQVLCLNELHRQVLHLLVASPFKEDPHHAPPRPHP